MITLQELCQHLDEYLNVTAHKDFCENGIQVEGKGEIQSIATSVSASLAAIEAAVDSGVQALLVHHGLFWNRDSYCITGIKRKKIQLLLDHGVSLLAYHLPLDSHPEIGNNWKAAKDMGWKDLEPFGIYQGVPMGVKGQFLDQDIQSFQKQLEDYYQHPATPSLGGNTRVRSAALVSGGAYKMLPEAAREGVDCFITGNFDEPAWYQAVEEGINFFAMGHAATEKVGPQALGGYIETKFSINHRFIDIPNPF